MSLPSRDVTSRPTCTLACLLLTSLTILSVRPCSAADDPRSPGTIRMAERLERVARSVDVMKIRFLAAEQAEILRRQLHDRPESQRDPLFRYTFADALLNAGRNLESVAEFERVESLAREAGTALAPGNRLNVGLNIALGYLREAERLNCLSNHNADSCLLPLRGGGIHRFQDPSRRAVATLTNLLVEFSNDLSARWLLNIAFMTLGRYPDEVPPRWLIPESAFASDLPFPRFPEIATRVGLAAQGLSGGSVIEDFDGDEQLDIMVTSIGLHDQMQLFRNRGDGTFADVTRAAGLMGLVGGLNLVPADFDNDGRIDVLVLRGGWFRDEGRFPKSLLRNRGDGTFDDVTEAAGLGNSLHPTQTATWFDFDGDGWLDLYIGQETILGQARHPSELFHNERNGTFREMGRDAGVSGLGYVKGVVAGDYNNDGRPDLYVSTLSGRNRLYRNDGPRNPAQGAAGGWTFTDVAGRSGVEEPIDSFPCWFFDYDNDGWEDILVTGYKIRDVGDIAADYLGLPTTASKARLYRNRGDGTFEDVSVAARLSRVLHAMGVNFGDLENDGWLDFYLGTGDPDLMTIIPNRLFRNAEGRLFQDVTTASGTGHLQKGHGVSFADLDNDGDQDLHEDMGGAVSSDFYPNVLFENPGFGNRWLKLRLEGVKANRCAIGARVRVDLEEQGRRRSIHRTVNSGGSFGANPFRLEIGLGKADQILAVEIRWPGSGTLQTVNGLQLDRMYRIREGQTEPQRVELKSFRFPGPHAAAHGTHDRP